MPGGGAGGEHGDGGSTQSHTNRLMGHMFDALQCRFETIDGFRNENEGNYMYIYVNTDVDESIVTRGL